MDKKKLGKKIKIARVSNDFSQIDLASEIGISQKRISRYETGLTMPSLDTLELISIALDKPMEYFLEY